jgi:hypothetical protein
VKYKEENFKLGMGLNQMWRLESGKEICELSVFTVALSLREYIIRIPSIGISPRSTIESSYL